MHGPLILPLFDWSDVADFTPTESSTLDVSEDEIHFGSVVPCIREVVHESGIFASVINSSCILARQSAFLLVNAHVIEPIFERRGYWCPFEAFVEILA
jgi:hypothetical protein